MMEFPIMATRMCGLVGPGSTIARRIIIPSILPVTMTVVVVVVMGNEDSEPCNIFQYEGVK